MKRLLKAKCQKVSTVHTAPVTVTSACYWVTHAPKGRREGPESCVKALIESIELSRRENLRGTASRLTSHSLLAGHFPSFDSAGEKTLNLQVMQKFPLKYKAGHVVRLQKENIHDLHLEIQKQVTCEVIMTTHSTIPGGHPPKFLREKADKNKQSLDHCAIRRHVSSAHNVNPSGEGQGTHQGGLRGCLLLKPAKFYQKFPTNDQF